ncbi:dihydrolipoamide acetyltransferase family protein [Tessaracoccus sp. MC1756]|uniref:dihydrolipoamide acetyltransferase family protein n=1 Tax=Tessaracoccus sp. MC1756 TaxID=2760311 RepID=UPI0016045789|nr:dihydrolipoamide acetyltransferase family protein [Tessaracoccus sp. MC1756]MBB1510948.1 2-oxo acid dehydrogenase subunit E2 [Tessaracoccus sp. MC1756]
MATILRMPEIAAGTESAGIQTWLVKRGDEVAVGQALVEIETDKAIIDMEAEQAGVFAGALVAEGDMVTVGSPIGVLAAPGEDLDAAMAEAGAEEDSSAGAAPTETAPSANESDRDAVDGDVEQVAPVAPEKRGADTPTPATPEPQKRDDGRPLRLLTSPLVRRLAKEHDLDLTRTKGSGPNGRILKKDVQGLVAAKSRPVEVRAASSPSSRTVDEDRWELVPHTGMRRAVARRLTESKSSVPHFYVVADCRMDELLSLRAKVNEQSTVRISVNDFILKAVAAAMSDVPAMNAVWSDDGTLKARHVDVAVAVAVEGGLLTPVVRDVDVLPLSKLATTVRDYAERARAGGLKQRELEGGTFTVSNLGMFGTKEFSAILNPPHSGILAVGAASQRAVVVDGQVQVANVMTVTLSADHRVVDGAVAAEWLAAFQRRIENPLGLLV